MTDLPAARSPRSTRRLAWRMRLARAALLWERVWPSAWPALCVLGIFAVLALFDLLPLLPGLAHAGLLAVLGFAFVAAIFWGLRRRAGSPVWSDPVAARRRIELASGLTHRPLQALIDLPSGPLDRAAAGLSTAPADGRRTGTMSCQASYNAGRIRSFIAASRMTKRLVAPSLT